MAFSPLGSTEMVAEPVAPRSAQREPCPRAGAPQAREQEIGKRVAGVLLRDHYGVPPSLAAAHTWLAPLPPGVEHQIAAPHGLTRTGQTFRSGREIDVQAADNKDGFGSIG